MAFTPKPNPHVVQPKPLRQRFVRGLKPWTVEHLYTSDEKLPYFPGRWFRVDGWCGFGKHEVKELLKDIRKANLTVRNFPATVADLRKRLKLAEGGDTYLFATTLNNGQKVLLRCGKL